jgi:molybdopterin converting factor subunit 1
MKVRILVFARLQELMGRSAIELDESDLFTVGDVWRHLQIQFPQLEAFGKSLLFSVNQEFADLETKIKEGDELAIFPPVSGGGNPATKAYLESETGDVYQIIRQPIQLQSLAEQLSRPEDGAVVSFAGIVRNNSRGRKTLYLEYEGYEPMALKKIREIGEILRRNWAVDRVGIVHRLGKLEIGEVSVAIVITSHHRHIAFEACRYAIDTLKKVVPIWKKEFFEDGEVWVEGELSET